MKQTRAYIYLNNLINNIELIKKAAPGKKICVPVKADAYGHGAVQTAQTVLSSGASYLAVANSAEGEELRNAGIDCPILLLGPAHPEEFSSIINNSISPLVFDSEYITTLNDEAARQNKTAEVHLKIDTGMGRIGCRPEHTVETALCVQKCSHLHLAGTCTHLAASDSLDENDKAYTHQQIEKFKKAVENIKDAGIDPGILHCANSGGVLFHPESHFDMVRPGIIVYGFTPETDISLMDEEIRALFLSFKPVMHLVSKTASINHHKKGDSISYGRTWVCAEDTDIASIPAGYADGVQRRFVPGLEVLINGKKYPVVGRICMDQFLVNLGKNHGVSRCDDVVIFGDGITCGSAQDIAQRIGTISYEIVCGISKRVERVYFKGE
jgi:alanine racemase